MAKKPARPQHTTRKVDEGIRKVRAFHQLGQQSLTRYPERSEYAKGQIDAQAKAKKINADTLRKARAFASQYGKPDLDELFSLCRKHCFAPNTSLILRLVTLPIKKERRALQREAIVGHWTITRLNRELAARYGARRLGGRLRAIPPDKVGLLAQLETMCEEWKRWYAALQRNPKPGAKKASERDLPPQLRKKVQAVLKQIEDLQLSVGHELMREVPGRIPLAAKGPRKFKLGDFPLDELLKWNH
jgi:hypothetical protein